MDRPMDEQERKHCLLDLHGIRETTDHAAASAAFVEKWCNGLESVLAEQPEDERIDPDDVAEIESDLRAAKNENAALSLAVETVLDKLERADDLLSAAKEALEKVAK